MVTAARAKKRLSLRRRRACDITARKRRLSHRAVPDLFRTVRVAEGATVDAGNSLPDQTLEVTFAGHVRREATGPHNFLTAGAVMSLGTDAGGGLVLQVGSFIATTTLNIATGRTFRFALAIRPNDSQVRLWVDSERLIAAQFGTSVLPWHDDGLVSYGDTASATLLDELDIFYHQRPRHFGDAGLVLPDPSATSILLRAAKATFQVGHWPFMQNPNL